MNKIISIALLVGGIILLGYGFSANDSVASGISRAVTGEPTDRAMYLLVSGAVLAVLGIGGLVRGSRP